MVLATSQLTRQKKNMLVVLLRQNKQASNLCLQLVSEVLSIGLQLLCRCLEPLTDPRPALDRIKGCRLSSYDDNRRQSLALCLSHCLQMGLFLSGIGATEIEQQTNKSVLKIDSVLVDTPPLHNTRNPAKTNFKSLNSSL